MIKLFCAVALVTLSTGVSAEDENSIPWKKMSIEDRYFHIEAFYCQAQECGTRQQMFGEYVEFANSNSISVFRGIPKLPHDWGLSLICDVDNLAFSNCRAARPSMSTSREKARALRMVRRIKVRQSSEAVANAYVTVIYEHSGCPQWLCTGIPPAPTPVPEK